MEQKRGEGGQNLKKKNKGVGGKQAGSRGGCLKKKGGGELEPPYKLCLKNTDLGVDR